MDILEGDIFARKFDINQITISSEIIFSTVLRLIAFIFHL